MIIDSSENKKIIVEKFLPISALEGWNINALELAFQQAQIDKKFIPLIFEDGIFSLIDFITQQRCENLAQIVKNNPDFTSQKTTQKIAFLIFNLLKIDTDNKSSLARLNNFYLNPQNILPSQRNQGIKPFYKALEKLYFVANFMWNLCGDNSTDYNFYTKRIILAKVLLRSYLFFLKDSSENSILTQNLIDKQLAKIIKFSRLKNSSKQKIDIVKNNIVKIMARPDFQNPQNFIRNLPFFRLMKNR